MPHLTYPAAGDLSAYLVALGLITPAQGAVMPLAEAASAASSEWEEITGWQPFLRDAADVSRRFDPPGPNNRHGGLWSLRGGKWVLDLRAGLLSVTEIVTGYSASPTNPQAGTIAVAEDDYWLLPESAPLEGRPYTHVEFASSRWGAPRSIRITGMWGYTADISGDTWQSLLESGALIALSAIVGQTAGGLIEWTEEAHERYGENPFGHFYDRWTANGRRAEQMNQRRIL